MYGTGTTSCMDSLTCLGNCPQDPDAGDQSTFDECTQKCFVDSCPDSDQALIAIVNCVQSSCATQCAGTGTTCDTCITSQCASQYQACSGATTCGTVPAFP